VPEGGKLTRHDIEGTTTRYAMRNGLTILFRERHSSPLVAISVYLKAGAFSEKESESGLAQLTARMIAKGTAAHPPGEAEKDIQRLGGVFQTVAAEDHISFRVTAPAESVGKALEVLADLLLNPAFPESELKKAAQETMRAGRRFQDDAAAASDARLYSTAYTVHPLKRNRFGDAATLGAFTRDQVVAFYQANYQPQNAVIAVAGDVIPSQQIGPMQLTFGKWAKVGLPAPAPTPSTAAKAAPATSNASVTTTAVAPAQVAIPEEPASDKPRYANARGGVSQSYITIGYRLPAPAATAEALKERATLEMLAAVLGQGRGARLFQVLRDGSRLSAEARDKGELASLVTGISTAYRFWPGAALLVTQMRIDPTRIDRAEAEFFREIERFKREIISEGELQRARYLVEKRSYDASARLEDEAELIARAQSVLGDFKHHDAHFNRLMAVTPQNIQAAAAKYLTFANTSVHEFEPATAQARTFTPESFAETMMIFAPTLARTVTAEEVKQGAVLRTFKQGAERGGITEGRNIIISEAPLPVKDFSVFRGPRAFVREDRSQPKLSVGIFMQGGRLVEDQSTSGMTELMLRAILKGSQTRKADLIALELESYGGEIQIVNEPDMFGFVLDVLSRNAEPATKLMLDLLENPYFDKAELAREREVLLADQMSAHDLPLARAEELLWASLYPNHPYGLPRFGLAAAVKAITVEQLEAWHTRSVKKQFPLISIVGDTDGSALVSRVFAEAFKRAELDKTLKVNLPPQTAPPEEVAEASGAAQTVQTIGIRTAAGQGNEPYALAIIAQAAGSRLANELITRQAIADEVRIINDSRLASGAFGVIAASAPSNEAKVREVLQAELVKAATAPPTDDDYERGRNAAIGTYAIGLQAPPARAIEYARLVIAGRKATDLETQPDLVRAIKQAELKRLAETTLKTGQPGLGVVRGKE
jgi:zinc protease